MLTQEYGTASNIKSRVNRLSVLAAITSTQQRLKLYSKTPPNGLIIYCGTILTDEGKEKKVRRLPPRRALAVLLLPTGSLTPPLLLDVLQVNIDFEPFKVRNRLSTLHDRPNGD